MSIGTGKDFGKTKMPPPNLQQVLPKEAIQKIEQEKGMVVTLQ